jgi:heavy metal sensor kinase
MAKFTRVFGIPKLPVHLLRGLRFRLTLSYVLFFTVLLVVIGLFFRRTLQSQMEGSVRDALEEEWGEAKGYLKIENFQPIWIADETDPEEAYIVSRIKHVFLITDATGAALDYDDTYESIGIDSPADIEKVLNGEPQIRVRYDKSGTPYMIKAGRIPDDKGRPYFFAIGRSLAPARQTVHDVTQTYFLMLPAMIALTGLLGWALAGRAIRPVNLVSHAARQMTGSNLSLQIPLRRAGDELDQLIDSFNRMTARLNQSFEQTRRFSTDVSHELRTPLTAIRGQLEVALFTAETPEQYRDAIVNSLEDVEKLSNIVRALLLLSQAESGQLALQRGPLDLGEAARDVVEQFQIPAEEKQVQLTAALAEDLLIHADRTQIERLISNLVSNAIKYTPAGGTVQVRVSAEPDGSAQLTVEDTGMGIPAENLPHIFDRFYRVRNASAIPGLGLGLSFVAWIVEAHGGRIDVASTVGQGTRFTVTLPASPRSGEEVHAGDAAEGTLI